MRSQILLHNLEYSLISNFIVEICILCKKESFLSNHILHQEHSNLQSFPKRCLNFNPIHHFLNKFQKNPQEVNVRTKEAKPGAERSKSIINVIQHFFHDKTYLYVSLQLLGQVSLQSKGCNALPVCVLRPVRVLRSRNDRAESFSVIVKPIPQGI